MDPTARRILKASGLGILMGRVVLPPDLINGWLKAATQSSGIVSGIGIDFVEGSGTLRATLSLLGNPMAIEATINVARVQLDSRKFDLGLALLKKPRVVEDGADTVLDKLVEKVGDAALSSLGPHDVVRLIEAAAPAVIQGHEDVITVHLDAIPAVRGLFDRVTQFGRPRDLLTIRHARVRKKGLVLWAAVHPLRALLIFFGSLSRRRRLS